MKQVPRTLYDKPWKHVVIALIAFILSYFTASWAIDTGRLLVYFLTLVLLLIGIRQLLQAVMKGNAH